MSQLMKSEEAEKMLGLKPNTLRTWRSRKTPGQPPYVRIGPSAVRYDPEALLDYIDSRTVSPRSDH